MTDARTEVLIIGAGAVGICAAHYLSSRGRQVAVLDKGEVCSGCSHGNAGLVVPSHSIPLAAPGVLAKGLRWMFNPESPFYIKPRLDPELFSWLWRFGRACDADRARRAVPLLRDLSLESARLFAELEALPGVDFGFEQRGLLTLYQNAKGLEEGRQQGEVLAEAGIGVRLLNPAQVRELEPVACGPMAGGIFYPQDAHLIPGRFVRGLARHLQEKGVGIHTGAEVLDFAMEGQRIAKVKTSKGEFVADEIVLASGSWSRAVARHLGLKLPIQPAKGYSITVKRPPQSPTIPLVLGEAKVGVTPMGESLRFAGTLELAGFDLSVNQRRVGAIRRAVPRYLPDLAPEKLEVQEVWSGLRPCTPDGLPFLGRPRGFENLVVAAGHAMIGVSLSPITGELVARIASGEETRLDLGLLRVERFG